MRTAQAGRRASRGELEGRKCWRTRSVAEVPAGPDFTDGACTRTRSSTTAVHRSSSQLLKTLISRYDNRMNMLLILKYFKTKVTYQRIIVTKELRARIGTQMTYTSMTIHGRNIASKISPAIYRQQYIAKQNIASQ